MKCEKCGAMVTKAAESCDECGATMQKTAAKPHAKKPLRAKSAPKKTPRTKRATPRAAA